MLLFATTAG